MGGGYKSVGFEGLFNLRLKKSKVLTTDKCLHNSCFQGIVTETFNEELVY